MVNKYSYLPFRKTLKTMGDTCNACFLSHDANQSQEALNQKEGVRRGLNSLIKSCTGNEQEIASEALKKCMGCDYTNNYVFQFVEQTLVRV
jgi:hypothetical protein